MIESEYCVTFVVVRDWPVVLELNSFSEVPVHDSGYFMFFEMALAVVHFLTEESFIQKKNTFSSDTFLLL